jgi:hypothetical protein
MSIKFRHFSSSHSHSIAENACNATPSSQRTYTLTTSLHGVHKPTASRSCYRVCSKCVRMLGSKGVYTTKSGYSNHYVTCNSSLMCTQLKSQKHCRHPLLCNNSFLKHVSVATNAHTTAEEMLETVFSNLSATKLHKESQ